MAGEVAQINSIINADNLARNLAGLYNNWWMQRSEKESEWRELRNYLFATDTTTTSNSNLPWKNKTTLPKLTQIRDNLHANYMDALFPNDDWLRWEGFSQDAVVMDKRRAIEAYMKNKVRESGFQRVISRCLYDFIDTGNVFGDVEFVHEKHFDPVTGKEETTYIGPKAVRISPFDHVFNPTAASYHESPKFTRYVMTVGEFMAMIKKQPNLMYDEAVVKKVVEVRNALTAFRMEDLNKAEGYLADGFGTLSEYYQSGIIEILEFEGTVYDFENNELLENHIITLVDRNYILRKMPNPSWFGRDSKEHVGWRERPDNLYAMGPLDNLVGLQYRLDHLENLKADAMDLVIHPPVVIKGDVEPFEWKPFAQIHVSEDGDVASLTANISQVLGVNNELGSILQLMEEMAGAPKEAMGIRTPGEKTAFEVQSLQNAAGRIFQNMINKFEQEFLEPLLNTMLEVARRNMDSSEMIRVFDDDIGATTFMTISREDITAAGKLRPIGSRHYAARAQLLQNLLGVFNSPIGQMIAPHVSAKKLAKMVEDYMGFDRFDFISDNVAIFEQAETKRLMNQADQQVGAEDMIPLEEDMQEQTE